MFPLHVIRSKAAEADLGFVLIGGHAVNVYAEPRATLDVDLLVRKEDRQPWLDLLAKEGFKLRRDGGNFLQLDPPYGVNWRLDLMLVNASTFAKILAGGKRVSCFGIDIVVPSPEHLIALKLHALAHGPEDRYEKDFSDIVGIARLTRLDPHSAVLKEIFDRYGNEEIYSKFIHRVESR
jgi:hypothetical protein